MLQIEKYSKIPRKSADIIGPVESDPEYQLIVEANNMAVDIDDEIGITNVIIFNNCTMLSYLLYIVHTIIL